MSARLGCAVCLGRWTTLIHYMCGVEDSRTMRYIVDMEGSRGSRRCGGLLGRRTVMNWSCGTTVAKRVGLADALSCWWPRARFAVVGLGTAGCGVVWCGGVRARGVGWRRGRVWVESERVCVCVYDSWCVCEYRWWCEIVGTRTRGQPKAEWADAAKDAKVYTSVCVCELRVARRWTRAAQWLSRAWWSSLAVAAPPLLLLTSSLSSLSCSTFAGEYTLASF